MILGFFSPGLMQEASGVEMVDEGRVAEDGLWLTRRQFGYRISPHGDCIKIHKGYIFVTWYQGGLDVRNVWLSRKKIGGDTWKHIRFPHRHVMFRKDKNLPEEKRKGDSHNTIAVGICPKDDTVHLLYDLHAYTPSDFKNDYFNYNISKKGAAVVPDKEWKADLFFPKQNFLNKEIEKKKKDTYFRATYPGFFTTQEGDLVVKWRVGGHTNASMRLTKYNGEAWGPTKIWNQCSGRKITGFYGDFRIFDGQMVACWHRRHKEDHKAGYINNRGLYLAYCKDESGLTDWYTADGKKIGFPLKDLDPFMIADPSKPGDRMSEGPSFVMTDSGAFHARVNVNGKVNKHYYRMKPTDPLKVSEGIPRGDMYAIGDKVYLIGLEDHRPIIRSTVEGQDEWKTEFKLSKGRRYVHGNTRLHGKSLFFYLMELGDRNRDKHPMHVLRFDLD